MSNFCVQQTLTNTRLDEEMSEITCTERAETVVDEEVEGGDLNKVCIIALIIGFFLHLNSINVFVNRIRSSNIQMMKQRRRVQAIAACRP